MSRSTLCLWKEKHSDISDALKKGKEVVDYEVENALLKSALEGNVTAQIFWLKNRKPVVWKDKRDDERKESEMPVIVNDIPRGNGKSKID